MDDQHSGRVWAAINAVARQHDAPVSVLHAVIACARELAALGAGLSMNRDGQPREPVLATGPRAEQLEELQFTLGEGPCSDTVVQHGPILVSDLTAPEAEVRWPAFAPAAAGQGARGMFCFPVAAGAAQLGVLDLYRSAPGPLERHELLQALLFADAVLVLALDERGGLHPDLERVIDGAFASRRAEVHQATGMVAVDLGVDITDALTALRAHAYATGRRLNDVAADILAGRLRLGGGPGPARGRRPSRPPPRDGQSPPPDTDQ
ncbi:GAF and ANTAR domain-containing protein [Actinomadura gamaensis]|uniref:GAF and ANTAR domain-containing protein n=1 Tax=Actinomadura gamaensis TaxID=1763541 RepID=A0ABV9TZS4_9ACTN